MSVNINVNGKFTKQSILSDPETYRKQLENERRKLRLQKVREQSKELARKIRNDVSKEKERQLRNLEAVKAQELNLWRKNVVAQKYVDYRNAMNQVGKAHYAARMEREAGKKKIIETRSNTLQSGKAAQKDNKRGKSDLNSETCEPRVEKSNLNGNKGKKQLHVCFDEQYDLSSCSSSNNSDCDSDELLSSSSSVSSTDVCCEHRVKSIQPETCKESKVTRAPAVLPDCNTLSKESEEAVVAPANVETTRQIDSVASTSPRKNSISTQTTATMASALPKNMEQSINDVEPATSDNPKVTETNPVPRYTLISDLIAKQQSTQTTVDQQATKETGKDNALENNAIGVDVPTSTSQEVFLPKVTRSLPGAKVTSPQRKSVPPYPTRNPLVSRFSTTSGGTTTSSLGAGDKTGNVQFYDYRNKYAKEYSQPPNAVAVPLLSETEPNAMEQAALENKRLKDREKKMEELRQRSEERGKAALEREQVRRDCADLTEKLDALMQKRSTVLPTDTNLHGKAYYAEKVARKEAKMNSAIEELLSRPAIITCPEMRPEEPTSSYRVGSEPLRPPYVEDLNLGTRLCSGESENITSRSTDTESSGSILLGYIDDQRDQIRSELTECDSSKNKEKREKLTALLERIEALRESLLAEINRSPEEGNKITGDTQAQQPYEGPKSVKKNEKNSQQQIDSKTLSQLEQRERELNEKEMMLQKKLDELAKIQKSLKTTQPKGETKATEVKITTGKDQIIERTTGDKPLEIVIKLKGDRKSSKQKSKLAQDKNVVRKEKPTTSAKNNEIVAPNRRVSYDSNSTAYKPVPSVFTKATEDLVDRMKRVEDSKSRPANSTATTLPTNSLSSATVEEARVEIRKRPRSHLNPLIAQYVQRLLGMTRESVTALGVSSSDIDTPSSSVVNITSNIAGTSGQSSMLSEDHLQRVERFINENRAFINELEESIKTQSTISLENSMRRFEEIWKQKFKRGTVKDKKQQPNQGSIFKEPKTAKVKSSSKKVEQKIVSKSARTTTQKTEKSAPKKIQVKELEVVKASARVIKDTGASTDGEVYATKTQLEHYAELTKNCSNRIAELTSLITKVRQEKQKLLEVTLTSISDNGRNSTEYADLPKTQNKEGSTKSDESTTDPTHQNVPELPIAVENSERKSEQDHEVAPLEKHKQTGRSRDSGISMPSRPVTALGHETDAEPQSYASSGPPSMNTNTQSSSIQQRKSRHPPPTLHRYSPQIPEDDAVHELSTIVEVETPATSRINTSTQQSQNEVQHPTSSNASRRAVVFPSFEEYVQELNLDLTLLDPEQSLRMEHEYNELIEALKDGQGDKAYNYEEFPTLTSYLKNITGNDRVCPSPETIEDLFGCLRLTPLIAKPFPSHREYLERLPMNSSDNKYLDSASLENLTEAQSAHSGTDSETMDIEEELKRRNILKESFRSTSIKYNSLSTSTGDKQSQSTTLETGVDKLTSTSTDSASAKFQRELKALGLKWPKSMRRKEKEAAALKSSSTSHTPQSKKNNIRQESVSLEYKDQENQTVADCCSDSDSSERPNTLREFLKRELYKHVSGTSSCDSSFSHESLRSQFFMAVLNSLTQSGSGGTNTNTASQSANHNGHERQKTSTPVQTSTMQSKTVNEHSRSNAAMQSQLFSGESTLSDVQVSDQKRTQKKKSPKKKGKTQDDRKH